MIEAMSNVIMMSLNLPDVLQSKKLLACRCPSASGGRLQALAHKKIPRLSAGDFTTIQHSHSDCCAVLCYITFSVQAHLPEPAGRF